jgi:hypothetical protein
MIRCLLIIACLAQAWADPDHVYILDLAQQVLEYVADDPVLTRCELTLPEGLVRSTSGKKLINQAISDIQLAKMS